MAGLSSNANYSIIPLTTDPDQQMTVTIPVNGQNLTLRLRVRYNSQANYWVMTVQDKYGNVLLDSIPLLVGQYPAADILGQYQYLELGSACLVNLGNTSQDSPDDTSLGTSFALAWGDSAPAA